MPLLEITAGDLLASGIYPSLPGEAPPLWADGQNVLFDSGQVRKAPGFTKLDTDTAFATRPSDLVVAKTASERRAFIGAGAKVHAYRTLDDLTEIGSGFSAGGKWVLLPWGNWLFGTNDIEPLQIWKHTASVLDTSPSSVTTPFTRCKTIQKFRNYLIAFNTSNSNTIAEWCDFGDPETGWTVTLTGSAGNLEMRDLDADIIAAVPLGDGLGIYTAESLTLFRYIGGTSRFGYKTVLESIGAITPRSVVSVGYLNYGITKEFIFVTDGNTYRHIHEPAMKKWIEENVDWSRYDETYGFHDKLNSQIVWFLPVSDGETKAIAYRYQASGTPWTRLAASMVVGAEQGVWDQDIVCDATGIYQQDKTNYNRNGVAMEAFIESKPLDAGDRRRLKMWDKLELDIQSSGTVTAYAAMMDKPDETPSWINLGTVDNELWIMREAPFIKLKLEATGLGSDFKLSGAKLYGSLTGWLN